MVKTTLHHLEQLYPTYEQAQNVISFTEQDLLCYDPKKKVNKQNLQEISIIDAKKLQEHVDEQIQNQKQKDSNNSTKRRFIYGWIAQEMGRMGYKTTSVAPSFVYKQIRKQFP
eukprot:729931_1